MTDEQVRALVRDAVARHLGGGPRGGVHSGPDGSADAFGAVSVTVTVHAHPSHARYPSLASGEAALGEDENGPCLIEPTVRCNHCGYCQSHGH